MMMMQLNKYQHSQKLQQQQQQQHQQRRPYNVVIRQQCTIISLTTIRRWKSKDVNIKTYSCYIRFIINSIIMMMVILLLIMMMMMICFYYYQHNWYNHSIYNQKISHMNIIPFQYHDYHSQPKDQQQQQQQQNHKLNQILFTGSFGLGHRMNKVSSIYHLLASPYLTTTTTTHNNNNNNNNNVKNDNMNHRIEFYKYIQIINVSWGTCPQPPQPQPIAHIYNNSNNNNSTSHDYNINNNIDIFEYLFQSTILSIPEILQYNNNHHHHNNNSKTFNDNSNNNNNDNNNYYGNKVLWIRNDVTGYYAGQSYKNSKLPILQQQQSQQQYVNNNNPNDTNNSNNNNSPNSIIDLYNTKFITDYQLYNYLYNKQFIGTNEIQKFIKYHKFHEYYMIGIHLRFGNGEMDHFISSKRNKINYNNINNQQLILQHLIHSIIQLYETTIQEQQQQQDNETIIKPLLVFVATDTASYIEPLRIGLLYYNISMIVYDNQIRIPNGYGVSYNPKLYETNSNISCYQNWYSSVMDMILLSKCNVVIASSRSTFTQIVPLNLLFLHNHQNSNENHNQNLNNHNSSTNSWKYCEMDLLSSITTSNISSTTTTTNHAQSNDTIITTIAHTKMTCFKNHTSWLLRNNHMDWITFCTTTKTSNNTSDTTTNNTFNNYQYNDPISSYDCNDMNRNIIFMNNNHENNNNNHHQQVKSSSKNQSIIPIEPVTHKLMLHLPDITNINTIHENKMYTDTIQYLQSSSSSSSMNDSTTTSTTTTLNDYYYYGKKYNTKYRTIHSRKKQQNKKLQQQQLLEVFQANWTWE